MPENVKKDNARDEKLHRQLAETKIEPLIIKLGIPTTISMLVTSVYNMADTYFVSGLGTSASGAVGVVFGLMAVIQAFGFMFGQGAGVLGSRALGQNNREKANRMDSTGLALTLITGVLISVFGIIFIDPFMRLLGSTDTILPYARKYSYFILLSAPLMGASCVLNNILRFEGKAMYSMTGLCSGGILNIFGDFLLVKVLDMGVTGAGISTAVSQTLSFVLLLIPFLNGTSEGKLKISCVSFDLKTIWEICSTGFPSLVRQGLSSISTMLLNNAAKVYGDAAVAAMSIVNRVCFFTFATALGIGQGFQPVAAYNYGARNFKRVQKAYIFTVCIGSIFLSAVAIIGFFEADRIIALFCKKGDDMLKVLEVGVPALKAQFVGQLFQPVAVCSNMLFQSVGKRTEATLLSTCRSGLFFIPILLILTAIFGLPGVQYAQAIGDMCTFFVAAPMGLRFVKKLGKME